VTGKAFSLLVVLTILMIGPLSAQAGVTPIIGPPAPGSQAIPAVSLAIGGSQGPAALSSALEIVLILTVLSLSPALILTMTSFTRIVVVLSFLKRATTIQEMPPKQVTIGIALFLTIFVMAPTFKGIKEKALDPYQAEQIDFFEAAELAGAELSVFLLRQTSEDDLSLIYEISKTPPAGYGPRHCLSSPGAGFCSFGDEDGLPDGVPPFSSLPGDRYRDCLDSHINGYVHPATGDHFHAVQDSPVPVG